jgi:hypothetical protein
MYKKSRHAVNMKAVRVVQASVMMGCYDLQCTCSAYARYSLTVHAKHDVSVDMDAVGHGMRDPERPRP